MKAPINFQRIKANANAGRDRSIGSHLISAEKAVTGQRLVQFALGIDPNLVRAINMPLLTASLVAQRRASPTAAEDAGVLM
jgi:hypothetical protein